MLTYVLQLGKMKNFLLTKVKRLKQIMGQRLILVGGFIESSLVAEPGRVVHPVKSALSGY